MDRSTGSFSFTLLIWLICIVQLCQATLQNQTLSIFDAGILQGSWFLDPVCGTRFTNSTTSSVNAEIQGFVNAIYVSVAVPCTSWGGELVFHVDDEIPQNRVTSPSLLPNYTEGCTPDMCDYTWTPLTWDSTKSSHRIQISVEGNPLSSFQRFWDLAQIVVTYDDGVSSSTSTSALDPLSGPSSSLSFSTTASTPSLTSTTDSEKSTEDTSQGVQFNDSLKTTLIACAVIGGFVVLVLVLIVFLWKTRKLRRKTRSRYSDTKNRHRLTLSGDSNLKPVLPMHQPPVEPLSATATQYNPVAYAPRASIDATIFSPAPVLSQESRQSIASNPRFTMHSRTSHTSYDPAGRQKLIKPRRVSTDPFGDRAPPELAQFLPGSPPPGYVDTIGSKVFDKARN